MVFCWSEVGDCGLWFVVWCAEMFGSDGYYVEEMFML